MRNFFLGKEKREYLDNQTELLSENKISELDIKNDVTNMCEGLITCQSEKEYI